MWMFNHGDDMWMFNQVNDMWMFNQVNDMWMFNHGDDMWMFNQVNDMWMFNQVNDMWMFNHGDDMWMFNQVNDIWMFNQVNDMWMFNQVNDMWMFNQVNDMWMFNQVKKVTKYPVKRLVVHLSPLPLSPSHFIWIGLNTLNIVRSSHVTLLPHVSDLQISRFHGAGSGRLLTRRSAIEKSVDCVPPHCRPPSVGSDCHLAEERFHTSRPGPRWFEVTIMTRAGMDCCNRLIMIFWNENLHTCWLSPVDCHQYFLNCN